MGKIIKDLFVAVMVAAVIPGVLFRVAGKNRVQKINGNDDANETSSVTCSESTAALQAETGIILVIMPDDSVRNLDMDAYITSVVLREMPADFEYEALKAQAVVARTYAMRLKEFGTKHIKGEICTDPACCQGFCSEADYMSSGGRLEDLEKVKQAVLDTKGEVLTYNGELIEATYFSCSGGKTESAKAVWGSDVPYLQSVLSPGEEKATHYTETFTITFDSFIRKLGLQKTEVSGDLIGNIVYTSGGGVETINIGGQQFTGVDVRRLLGLRSTSFVITAVGSSVTITTKGFGHRVGMSQYGADAMAVLGNDYRQILSHYYHGTVLQQYQMAD